jgi:ribosomal protein L22|tara:strand:+ start:305 stop:664 length:360 start_codon:yes stop_codon:yes gene_type:complete
MEQNLIDIYDLVEHAIDNAFGGQMNLKFYDYLKDSKTKKHEIDQFISSPTTNEIGSLILDLDEYIKGGSDDEHKQLREGYGHIPKPQARKIRNYLESFINDAERYSYDRRPGRRKKQSK